MSYESYHKSLVDCKKIKPHVEELVARCGNAGAAAEYALVGSSTLRRIMNDVHCTVQIATARKILIALEHRREEDSKNHSVHENLLKIRREQAMREDRIGRMAGY